MSTDIFKDLRVVELSSVLAGPAVGMFFAELGAEVIKIENQFTDGDVTRSWKLPTEDADKNTSAYYHSINWNKKSLLRNLNSESHKNEIYELISSADIVVSNFRPTSAKKLGFDYPSLKKINPQLLFGLITAYGDKGDRPGFDALIQAETGWMHMNGNAGGPPVKMPVALMDIIAAHHLKEGLLVAMVRKLKTGKGARVSVSLYDAAIASLANQASNWLNLGHNPIRKGSQHPNIAPYGDIIKSNEGTPLLLAIGNQKQFRELCTLLGCPELTQDEKFLNNIQRVKHRQELIDSLKIKASKLSTEELLSAADQREVPIGRINDLKSVFAQENAQPLILKAQEKDGSISQRVRTAIFKLSES